MRRQCGGEWGKAAARRREAEAVMTGEETGDGGGGVLDGVLFSYYTS